VTSASKYGRCLYVDHTLDSFNIGAQQHAGVHKSVAHKERRNLPSQELGTNDQRWMGDDIDKPGDSRFLLTLAPKPRIIYENTVSFIVTTA
jgi:hypothetical protein